MTKTWGDVINAVRTLHLKFYEQFPFPDQEVALKTHFYFPPTLGTFGDWEPLDVPYDLITVIECHAVERLLAEGPLSPNEEISIKNETEVSFLVKQILMLEREWLAQMNLLKPEMQKFLEESLHSIFLTTFKPRLKAV